MADLNAEAATEAYAFTLTRRELEKATAKFPPFHSAHEGYAILLEEVRELEHEVFHGSRERQTAEAVQVAAMAIRFLKDICNI